ncbi:MAG TPA: hypothetical protein PLR02_09360, partial [Rhodocyclaceae bacterium]|nr:hypothetical protein [Rhodocyclaceae bacterium]
MVAAASAILLARSRDGARPVSTRRTSAGDARRPAVHSYGAKMMPQSSALKILNLFLAQAFVVLENSPPVNLQVIESMYVQSSPTPVRFGHNSGFAFDGDLVRLEADLVVTAPLDAAQSDWSLQLWAEPVGVAADGVIKLAELALGTLRPDEYGRVSVAELAPAFLPAGAGEYQLALALAGRNGAGEAICDRVDFPRAECFVLPRLDGTVSYKIDGGTTRVQVDRIVNPRPVGNLSGTLALELWALPAPYLGGAFAGAQIGAVVLGSLAGQAEWQDVQVDLPTFALAPGQWHLALMLREWTGNGYLTRDYSNFAIPVAVAEAPAAGVEPAVDAPAPAADAVAAVPVAAPELAPARKPAAKRAKPAAGAKAADKASGKKPAVRVSLNNGSEWDLLSLPGVSPKVAAGIVAGRPWEAVDDLSKV